MRRLLRYWSEMNRGAFCHEAANIPLRIAAGNCRS